MSGYTLFDYSLDCRFGNESIASLWEAESNHENHIQGQMIGIAQIGEKIIVTSVQLSVCEVLAVASGVSGDLHNQTREPYPN